MNITFTTVLLLIIFSPGLIFNASFFSGLFSRRDFKIINQLALSFVPGFSLHIAWYFLAAQFNFKISLKMMGLLLMGPKTDKTISECLQYIESQIEPILIYFLTICFFSFVLGLFFRLLIRKLKLDRTFKFLRFANFWHYLLSGEYLDFAENKKNTNEIGYEQLGLVLAFVMVESDSDKSNIIYRGIVVDPILYSEGELKTIYLSNPWKIFVDLEDSDKKVKKEFIPGILMIPYQSIININVRYYMAEEVVQKAAESSES
jgi:hypothetical protein